MYSYELQVVDKKRNCWQGKYSSDFKEELVYYNNVRYKGKGQIIDTVTGSILIERKGE
jgi:hypothetical protein